MSSVRLSRTSSSTMGMASAISAVATTKIRNTSTAPTLVAVWCAKVTRLRITPLSISLVTFAQQTATAAGAVLVFLIFVVATAEIALAIPIVLLLVRSKRTLDLGAYNDLKG